MDEEMEAAERVNSLSKGTQLQSARPKLCSQHHTVSTSVMDSSHPCLLSLASLGSDRHSWLKWNSLSHVQLFATPWTVAYQAPLSMEFSRQEYWSVLSTAIPFPGDLPNQKIKPASSALQADCLPSEPPGKPKNTGVGSLSLLQGIFPTQELNRGSCITGRFFTSWATREALTPLRLIVVKQTQGTICQVFPGAPVSVLTESSPWCLLLSLTFALLKKNQKASGTYKQSLPQATCWSPSASHHPSSLLTGLCFQSSCHKDGVQHWGMGYSTVWTLELRQPFCLV